MTGRMKIKVQIIPEGQMVTATGRDAWALRELLKAGAGGCTAADVPAPRWSHYVYKLRRAGLTIETIDEPHGGEFPGRHARYVLRSPVQVIEETQRAAA